MLQESVEIFLSNNGVEVYRLLIDPCDLYKRQDIVATNRIKQTQSKNSNYNGSYCNFSVLYTYLLNNYPEIIDI